MKGAWYPGGFSTLKCKTRFQNVPFTWVNSRSLPLGGGVFNSMMSDMKGGGHKLTNSVDP
jgi:hypothetical protein